MKKGFKKLLAVTGLLAVAVPTSLSVTGCDFNDFLDKVQVPGGGTETKNDSNSELVVKAINKALFKIEASTGGDADEFIFDVVSAEFVKQKLPAKIKKFFNSDAFKIIDIINKKGKSLSDDDLKDSGTVCAKLIYNYAEYMNENFELIILVK